MVVYGSNFLAECQFLITCSFDQAVVILPEQFRKLWICTLIYLKINWINYNKIQFYIQKQLFVQKIRNKIYLFIICIIQDLLPVIQLEYKIVYILYLFTKGSITSNNSHKGEDIRFRNYRPKLFIYIFIRKRTPFVNSQQIINFSDNNNLLLYFRKLILWKKTNKKPIKIN